MHGIYHLKGTVKHYDWGGGSFIPSLLNETSNAGLPYAEYWLGIHPQAGCVIEIPGGGQRSLEDLIGERSAQLPYLLKILDVEEMLSIQVHPSKADAEREFATENAAGIPLDSPKRNYRDDNHKPELAVALGEFWILHGFKPEAEMNSILAHTPELNELLPVFKQSDYQGLYTKVMQMPQQEVTRILQPLVDRIIPMYHEGKLDKSDENFWAAKAALKFQQSGKIDRGIFSIYFFNLLRLKNGEGIFQDAGVPHAYLQGRIVEIMASSDNVLRGGLTTKKIDVKELLKHVKFEPTHVKFIAGEQLQNNEKKYKTPIRDFELSVFKLDSTGSISFSPRAAEILLLTEGKAILNNGKESLELEPGKPSAIVFPGKDLQITTPDKAIVFRATVPEHGVNN